MSTLFLVVFASLAAAAHGDICTPPRWFTATAVFLPQNNVYHVQVDTEKGFIVMEPLESDGLKKRIINFKTGKDYGVNGIDCWWVGYLTHRFKGFTFNVPDGATRKDLPTLQDGTAMSLNGEVLTQYTFPIEAEYYDGQAHAVDENCHPRISYVFSEDSLPRFQFFFYDVQARTEEVHNPIDDYHVCYQTGGLARSELEIDEMF